MNSIRSWRHGFVLAAGLAVSVASVAVADGRQDLYYQVNQRQFFDNAQNARTFGMAGSSVATSMDSSSVLGNPAGLGFMKDAEISGGYAYDQVTGNDYWTYDDVEATQNSGQVMGAMPLMPYADALPEWGNLGMGYSMSKLDGDDEGIDQKTWKIHLAYAKALSNAWSLGYSINYQHTKTVTDIWDLKMRNGVRQAVGAQYKMSPDTTFGLQTFYGFGSGDLKSAFGELDLGRDKLRSWGMEGGVAQKVWYNTLLTSSIDYIGYWQDKLDDANAWNFRIGAENAVTDWLTLRAGYRYAANMGFDLWGEENAKFNAVSFGAGTALGKYFRLDYGAEYKAIGDGEWTHMVTASVPFSLCK